MASDTSASSQSMSGLSQSEAQEFHKVFVMSFIIFTAVAALAHLLVWLWRPWIPGPEGYASLESSLTAWGPIASMIV